MYTYNKTNLLWNTLQVRALRYLTAPEEPRQWNPRLPEFPASIHMNAAAAVPWGGYVHDADPTENRSGNIWFRSFTKLT